MASSPVIQPGYRKGMHPPNYGRSWPAEPLTAAEVAALLAACSNRAPSGIRNRALIVVLWRGGLRVGEALALRPKDVDTAGGTIAVLHGKGDKRRTVGIDPQAGAVIDRWLEVRGRLGISGHAPLFCSISAGARGRALGSSYVRQMLRGRAERAGIAKRVHPHGLRHTHAFELADEGTPLHLIQAQLGHSSLATTDRYVRHIAPVALVRAMQARSWPNGEGA